MNCNRGNGAESKTAVAAAAARRAIAQIAQKVSKLFFVAAAAAAARDLRKFHSKITFRLANHFKYSDDSVRIP